MPNENEITHALSFDIEDWFHMVGIAAVEDPRTWADLPTLVEQRTDQILALLASHGTRATFFVLGWVAAKYPDLVRRIHDEGHEIATHSYWHRRIFDLSRDDFRDDMEQCIDAIAACLPANARSSIRGFRAPSFSITAGSEWAFDVLLECGLAYDSSLFPASRGDGGYANCPAGAHVVTTPSGRSIHELPISVARFGPGRLCYSGGGYMRLLPFPLIERGLRQEADAGRPTVVYLHPRDFAPDCPRVPMPPHRRFKCYVGLRTTESKLRRLLARHRWTTCADVLGLES